MLCLARVLFVVFVCQISFAKAISGFNIEAKALDIAGKKIFCIPFKGVNVVTLQIGFKNAGRKLSPKGKEALVALVESALCENTSLKSRAQILAFMREHNLLVSVGSSDDNFIISGTCPSKNVKLLLELIEELVFKAKFLEHDLQRVKQQMAAESMQALQQPIVQMDELIKHAIMSHHPYGNSIVQYAKSLSAIKANDLKEFIAANFTFENVHMAVSGEVDESVISETIAVFLAKLPKTFKQPTIANIDFPSNYKLHHQDCDVPQTVVKLVHKGIDMHHSDFFALQIATLCLSNSTSGVLWKAVRESGGLTYDLASGFDIKDHFSVFGIATATATKNVDAALKLINEVLVDVSAKGFSEENFELVKANFLGNYKRSFSSSKNIAARFLNYSMNDFGIDRYQQVIESVQSLTVTDINQAFKKFFDISCVHLFTVGR